MYMSTYTPPPEHVAPALEFCNLVNTWVTVERSYNKKSLSRAIREMNEAVNGNYTPSRIHEWRTQRAGRGNNMNSAVRKYMLRSVIQYTFAKHGFCVSSVLAGETLEKICNELT